MLFCFTRNIKRVLSLKSLTPLHCHLCQPGFLIADYDKYSSVGFLRLMIWKDLHSEFQ